MAILLDEKYAEGVRLPFLGRPALTSLAAAQLALKYDLLMVPAYGIRSDDGDHFNVVFEDPIPHGDPVAMTQAFNTACRHAFWPTQTNGIGFYAVGRALDRINRHCWIIWQGRRDSNPRPSDLESDALPTELHP